MNSYSFRLLLISVLAFSAGSSRSQSTAASQSSGSSTSTKAGTSTQRKTGPPGQAAMTNRDVIRLVQAKIADDLIISKIAHSKTKFDTSTEGLIALKQAGASDRLIAVMMNPETASAPPSSPAPVSATSTPSKSESSTERPAPEPRFAPSQTAPKEVAATGALTAKSLAPKTAVISQAPQNYGLYIDSNGELKPLGRIQTKVQISKFRTLLKSIPFVRQKIDINVPGAHSANRFETLRPTFYAYFPSSRDVSKFKLLQAKITGQKFDQRTLANASILYSTEQNQDEVPCDIGPTTVKDLYRITPREDIPTGEFGFIEGNTASQSASNIEILDVYDFGVDRKEEKLALKDYLNVLPAANVGDTAFLAWSKEDAQKRVDDREGNVGITGSLMGWFKRQYASVDAYWADAQFARGFARLEMLDKSLTPEQTTKLCGLLLSQNHEQYYIVVSIGGKIGPGHLIGANEGERLMRPFDASLTNSSSKDVVPASHLEFLGGYAGLWKVEFSQNSIRGALLNSGAEELIFEARLNQNLDFRAKFPMQQILPTLGMLGNELAQARGMN